MRNVFSTMVPRRTQPAGTPTGGVEIVKNPDGSISVRRGPGSGLAHPTGPRG